MSWIIQKAVELGATAIVPLITERSAWHPKPHGGHPSQDKSGTWQRVALEAARQCRRAWLPPVARPVRLADLLASSPADELRIHLDVPGVVPHPVSPWSQLARQPLTLLVGPEGGWSPEERLALVQAGSRPVHLGARVLRTETAGLAMLAWLAAWDAGAMA